MCVFRGKHKKMLGSLISKNSEQAVIEGVFLYNRRIGGEYKNYLCLFYSFFMQEVHIEDIFNFLGCFPIFKFVILSVAKNLLRHMRSFVASFSG